MVMGRWDGDFSFLMARWREMPVFTFAFTRSLCSLHSRSCTLQSWWRAGNGTWERIVKIWYSRNGFSISNGGFPMGKWRNHLESMDWWRHGQFTGHPLRFHVQRPLFPVKMFPNKPIQWLITARSRTWYRCDLPEWCCPSERWDGKQSTHHSTICNDTLLVLFAPCWSHKHLSHLFRGIESDKCWKNKWLKPINVPKKAQNPKWWIENLWQPKPDSNHPSRYIKKSSGTPASNVIFVSETLQIS